MAALSESKAQTYPVAVRLSENTVSRLSVTSHNEHNISSEQEMCSAHVRYAKALTIQVGRDIPKGKELQARGE
jgi:hypothetical protein